MNTEEFKTTWETLLAVARMAQCISIEDVQELIGITSLADTLGPIIYPTEYRDGMNNVEEQRILAEGFLEFRKAIEQVKEIGLKSGAK